MASVEDLRAAALALPEALEQAHFGVPSFRVNGKIFAQEAVREPGIAILKLTSERLEFLCEVRSEVFTRSVWGKTIFGKLALARIQPVELADYVEESWRNVAPKRLAFSHASLSHSR